MTTMFVQLRRVVYLLVLLQCCACVAYAQSGSTVNDHYFKQKVEDFKLMYSALKNSISNAEESSMAMDKEFVACDVYSSHALNAVYQLKSLTEGAEAEMSPINTSTRPEEMKEQRKKFETALQEAKDDLSNVTLAVNKTREAAEEVNKALNEVERLAETVISYAEEILDSPPKLSRSSYQIFLGVEELVRAGKREGEYAQSFATEIKPKVQPALDAAKKVEEQAESLKVEVELAVRTFNEYLEKHGLNPEEETTDSQQNTSENEVPEKEGADEIITGNENGEGNVQTPEENEGSQNNTPKPSDSSSSGTSPSQEEETTNSPSSSDSTYLDNTRPSDSSSSPALVHSPLLLLLVSMCVLGCTAVF
ncbi:uncharacterized protein TM35_000821040 [Trypanosoma theileri]|uniref:Uncharacterized protein n=1 Tax=Trypanosoma theileri TaxID=67003 RepID=A0A1X0NEW1_9TRYP|nr:uncharacterized protein TM35_000821040 [Trypanosoma theileri]ORC82814.1 hypothetical protein TM35_000821040 [Trypanosoma theileri]